MNKLTVKISKGNRKIGRNTWNVSLTPVKSCPSGVPCAKLCYAMKSYRQYPNVRTAWDHNLELWQAAPNTYFASIQAQLSNARTLPKFFRWHVSGDIQGPGYFGFMRDTARMFPTVKFLAFTKAHATVNLELDSMKRHGEEMPANFSLVFSAWPGMPVDNPHGFPVAWCQDGTETRAPETALHCPGLCESCGMCWELATIGRDVTFDVH